MDSLIIQVGSRHGRASELIKNRQKCICIGRGFDNDIIINDPYVAANQICLEHIEQQWQLSIMDRTNPVLLNGKPIDDKTAMIKSGDTITLGRSVLTVFSEHHPIENTRKLLISSWLHRDTIGLLLPFAALIFASLLNLFVDYQLFSIKHDWKEFGSQSLIGAVIIIFWAGIWSIVGRLLRHQPHFASHLLITTGIFTLLIFTAPLVDYFEYISNSITVGTTLNYLLAFIAITLLLKLNLFFATNIQHTTRWSLLVSSAILLLVFSIPKFNQNEFNPNPVYSKVLKPPFMHIGNEQTIDHYISELETIFETFETKQISTELVD